MSFRMRSNRSRRASTGVVVIVFLLVLSIVGYGIYTFVARRVEQHRALQAIDQVNAEVAADALAASQRGEPFDAAAAMGKVIAAADRARATALGTDRKAFERIIACFRKIQPVLGDYQSKGAAIKSALNPKELTSKEAIATSRKNVRAAKDTNQQLSDAVRSAPADLRAGLLADGVTEPDLSKVVSAVTSQFASPEIQKIRDYDKECFELMIAIDDLLEANWGEWRFDEQQHALLFENAKARVRYNDMIQKVKAIAAEEAAVQQTLLSGVGKKQGK